MNRKNSIFKVLVTLLLTAIVIYAWKNYNLNPTYKFGQKIDDFNGVAVYYNGKVSTVKGRNVTADHYNLGLKYQCVEFVKRYYYEKLNHKMPNSYGNAKDFFDKNVQDGKLNRSRNLIQYQNPSATEIQEEDLIIFDGSVFNKFGHVAIVSKVSENEIELVQQNSGQFGKSRASFSLKIQNGTYYVANQEVLGWLRKK
jgi:surface antigen